MSLKRFADRERGIRNAGEGWRVYAHTRTPFINLDSAGTAAICVLAPDAIDNDIDPSVVRNVRKTLFGQPKVKKQVSLATLRKAVGRTTWRDGWTPRSRSILGVAVFDMVLLGRALSAAPSRGDRRVTIELSPFRVLGGRRGGTVLRIVGKGWRAVIASRSEALEDCAPLDLRSSDSGGTGNP